jgi:hypothetical protein
MKKEFVRYDQALALKELGFDEKCYGHYDSTGELNTIEEYARVGADILHMLSKKFNSESYMKEMCSAPLKQQVFRWFRENYNVLAAVYSNASGYLYEWHDSIGGTHRGWSEYEGPNDSGVWDTYEEAENALIDKLIEIVKQK